jgi:hypothetical protein
MREAGKFREGQKFSEQRLSAFLNAGGSHGAKSWGHHLGQLDASAATVLISDEAFGTVLHDAINERTNIADRSLGIGIFPPICGANWPEGQSSRHPAACLCAGRYSIIAMVPLSFR